MKISVFTATHKPAFLNELYESIKAQTHKDWERILIFNNGAKVPDRAANDERIIVEESKEKSDKIWFWKRKACTHGTGEILLEVDHDDMLTPDCLEEVAKAFEDKEVGFVYSDNAKLWPFRPYNPAYGWTTSSYPWGEKDLIVMNSLPETPHNLSYIWFMPDHVRAWRRSAYWEAWGHDETMDVLDDQDLIIKTYLVTRFKYIPKCLYIYRITGENTSLNDKNARIQQLTVAIYDKYIYSVAKRRSKINNLRCIDLCGGINWAEWYETIDLHNADIIANLNEGIPLEDNSVWVIRAHDALEHLHDQIHTMKEIYRVLAPGWILLSSTPSTDGRWARQDPTHVSFWNENSFWYYIKSRPQPQYIHNTEFLFGESRLFTWYPSEQHKMHRLAYVQANLYKPVQND